jgi:prepilin-type N-terminal cleavage/methylation domain-containing protein
VINTEKGFTLIEVIAVLMILGILAAMVVPRYISAVNNSKTAASKSEIAEMKASLNLAYAKYFMSNHTAPTSDQVVTTAGYVSAAQTNVGSAPDIWNITLTAAGSAVAVTVNTYGTDADVNYKAVGTWTLPE